VRENAQLRRLKDVTLRAYKRGDWRKMPIKENGQQLVQVPQEMVFPFYAKTMKLVADERMFLREKVYEMMLRARMWLQNHGLDLKVYDGWRSIELQENLFWYYMKMFTSGRFGQKDQFEKLDSPDLIRTYFKSLPPETQTAMLEVNRTYVSWPSKDPEAPSPHATGGAIDVWLFENGVEADLGVPFDWMEENAGAFYHLKSRRKRFPVDDQRVCWSRTKLILAMAKAGFSCYGPEFWHFNYGNQMDALVRGNVACYSYIEP